MRATTVLIVAAVVVLDCQAVSAEAGGPDSARTTKGVVARVQEAARAARQHAPIPERLNPPWSDLYEEADVGRCDYRTRTRRLCRRGAPGSHRVIIALGDSHARAWIPALEGLAKRAHYAAYYFVKPACNAASVKPGASPQFRRVCGRWRDWAIRQIRRIQPEVVVLASRLPPNVLGPHGAVVTRPAVISRAVQHGLVTTVEAIEDRVGTTFITEENPWMRTPAAVCLTSSTNDLGDCANPPVRLAKLEGLAQRRAARDSSAQFIRTRQWFCAGGLCPAVVGSTITHRDYDHLTTAYSEQLSWPLQRAMHVHRLPTP